MKIAHLSDSHLGFRAYSRNHPSGINQREIDVMMTFKAVLASILAAKPDLVVHAGDFFHVVRPSNHTIDQAFGTLMDFQRARNFAPFVLVGGNHDSPKSVESGNIQKLLARIPGVRFAANMAERFDIEELDTEVLCVPSNSILAREEVTLRPTLGRRYSVLSVHGMASQALPKAVDTVHADFDVNDLHPHLFTYTALGDYHNHAEYAPNCCFSGSTDFTSSNPWDEISTPKGWVEFDTEIGQLQHIEVLTRNFIDLPVVDAADMSVEQIQTAIAAAAQWPGEPVVRQKITNVHPQDRRQIFSGATIRDIQSRCLNYQVVTTPPSRDRGDGTVTVAVAGAATSIEGMWEAHAAAASIPQNLDRAALVAAGLDLLREAQAA